MSENIWEEFDKSVDLEGLQKDVEDAAKNQTEYKEVPKGNYEVSINKLELKKAKSGNPMVSCWMKILNGDYKGQTLFMNQVVHIPFGIHLSNEFLQSLGTEVDVKFDSYAQYSQMLEEVHKETERFEYNVEFSKDSKGYNKYTIEDIYELEED